MIWLVLILGIVGLSFYAFFSGTETGFFRVARVRLVLDALGGDWVARALLWITNRPSLFVATTLVGNNLANYLMTLAIVMGTQMTLGKTNYWAELAAPLILAPLLFVYGDLLPKSLFLQAPNRLLRRGGPLFCFFVVLFLPVSIFLWGLNRLLARLVSETPEKVRLGLARRELQQVLDEGHLVGILHPAQQTLARGIFAVTNRPVASVAIPLRQVPRGRLDMTQSDLLRLAKRYRMVDIPIEASRESTSLAGYARVIDLAMIATDEPIPLRPLLKIPAHETHLNAMMRMESHGETVAEVVDHAGQTLGILTDQRLRDPLFRGKPLVT